LTKICTNIFLSIVILFSFNLSVFSQSNNENQRNLLFIFDASQSMLSPWQSKRKVEIAKDYLIQIVDSLSRIRNLEMGLRVYGHQTKLGPGRKKDCNDTKLEVSIGPNNSRRIISKILEIEPKGTTPISLTLEKAGQDFPICSTCENIIIILTDGLEECGGDPCAVYKSLIEKGIIVKPFIIGLNIEKELFGAYDCLGEAQNATTEENFMKILKNVIDRSLNRTTVQVNLLDTDNKANETDVNMSFYNSEDGKLMYNYIHTINHRGNPDTINIVPNIKYNIVVNTTPQVEKKDVFIKSGQHNIIEIKTPQGKLQLASGQLSEYQNLQAIVRNSRGSIVNVQNFETSHKYLVGKYDLEILTLPRINLKEVEIKQSFNTKIEIPIPGVVIFAPPFNGVAGIYLEKKDGIELIYDVNTRIGRQTVTLQPGNYRLIYKPFGVIDSEYTSEKKFTIVSGESLSLNLN
jgi:Ca-activated chloride channel homolog